MAARFKTKGLTRRAGNAPSRVRTILVCYDGEKTEAEYFQGWKRTLGSRGIEIKQIYVKSGGNALDAVRASISVKEDDADCDEFWCVCDVDDTPSAALVQAISLAKSNSINLAISRRCFEVWIALHWHKISTAPVNSEKEARALVAKHYPKYARGAKSLPFSVLLPLTNDAIKNAEWLESQRVQNPFTEVHKLILKLFSYYT